MSAEDPIAQQIAPGVLGYTMEHGGATYIPVIMAEKPGSGDVSRFLDSLPRNKTYRFPCVLSPKLRLMLEKRGFVQVLEYSKEYNENVEVYERKAE